MAASSSNQQVALVGPTGLIKKDELLRLIIQFLYSLGFRTPASQLEQESNISLKSPLFALLESLILQGKWKECIQVLVAEIKDHIKSEPVRSRVLFLILQQCICEGVRSGDITAALRFLQKDYSTSFGVGKDNIHDLGMEFFYKDSDRMREFKEMRKEVVTYLEECLPPPLVVPKGRLEGLVEMCLHYQRVHCMYHNTRNAISLFENPHYCSEDRIPSETLQVLKCHENEVWFVQFSHNGKLLASSSSDCTAIIWKVPEEGNLTEKHTLRGHENPVSTLSWSPNDAMLLTCGQEILKLWNVERGVCKCSFRVHVPILSSCAWLPDSTSIVFGTCGPKKCINRYKIDEKKLTRWVRSTKDLITALAITPDGNNFICIYSEGYIRIWNHKDHTKSIISENLPPITSVCISRDSRLLLVNFIGRHDIHMWDVAGNMPDPLIYQLHHKQLKFVIHSCFGLDSMFIASGSEDSQVYIWRYGILKPIKILTGHSMVVNCVSWNPQRPQMLASASDDRTIRIWVARCIN